MIVTNYGKLMKLSRSAVVCVCAFNFLWFGVRASAVKMLEYLDELEASRCNEFLAVVKNSRILDLFQFTKELSCEKKPVLPFAFKFKS